MATITEHRLFKEKSYVRKLRGGKIFEIVHSPEHARMDKDNSPVYVFRQIALKGEKVDGVLRVLSANAMARARILRSA